MKVLRVYKEYSVDKTYDDLYVGKQIFADKKVESMEYHEPRGEGDAHYVDVKYDDGSMRRIFKPDSVEFEVE